MHMFLADSHYRLRLVRGRKHDKFDFLGGVILVKNLLKILMGAILLLSGVSKVINPLVAAQLILHIFTVTLQVAVTVISILSVGELALGLWLVFDTKNNFCSLIAVLVYLGFLVISIAGRALGLTDECGCFGSIISSKLGWNMIIRNFLFFITIVYVWWFEVKSYNLKIK